MMPLLYCKRYGAGAPLLILHGLFGCWDNWHPVAKDLAQRFSVYVPDLRNHGRSFHSPRFDYEAMAEDVERLMDALAIGRAVLLGHSMGGKVALRFAALRPERVQRLIVVDITHKAAVRLTARPSKRSRNWTCGPLKDSGTPMPGSGRPSRTPLFASFYSRALSICRTGPTTGKSTWTPSAAICRRFSGRWSSAPFPNPVSLSAAPAQPMSRTRDWPEITSALPQARLVTIPGAGHWPHIENKAAFLSAVDAFLNTP